MAACRSSQLAVYLLVITIMSVVCNVFASSSVSVFELTNWQMLRLRDCYYTTANFCSWWLTCALPTQQQHLSGLTEKIHQLLNSYTQNTLSKFSQQLTILSFHVVDDDVVWPQLNSNIASVPTLVTSVCIIRSQSAGNVIITES